MKTGIHVALNVAPSIQKARVRITRARGPAPAWAPTATARGRLAQEDPTGGDHDARAPEVGESPGRKAEDAVGEGVDGERAGEARAAPAELLEEGAEEDAERVLGTVGDEEDEERARDDDPAVENFQV